MAFHVGLSEAFSGTGTIVFTWDILNTGNGYNNATGIFTAPYSGLYAFSVSTTAKVGKLPNVMMDLPHRNRGCVAVSHVTGSTASCSAVAHMSANEKMYIVGTSANTELDIASVCLHRCNTLSGVLIHSDL